MANDKVINEYTYEESISALEAILDKMDSGETSLDESMKSFEQGMKLVTRCEEILSQYERRITKLVETKGGEFKEEEFYE